MIKNFRSLVAIIFLCVSGSSFSESMGRFIAKINDKVSLTHQWSVDDSQLLCVVDKAKDEDDSVLKIYQRKGDKQKEIYSASPGAFPFLLQEFGGKLVVVWGTATGYLIHAYDFDGKIVKQIVDDGSYFMPEFFYVGRDYKPAMAVPILKWVKASDDTASVRTVVSADVYVFGVKETQVFKNVPWKKRVFVLDE